MIIGRFIYDKHQDSFVGEIATLDFGFKDVHISPAEKVSDKYPDYFILGPVQPGFVDLGVAWKRKGKNGGRDFLSCQLQSPLRDEPLYVSIFFEDDGKSASMVWNRAKAELDTSTKAA